MKILLINPEYPDTFWSYKHALKFIHKKALLPPLGLLTVAALLPADWNKKLVDMNVHPLKDKDIAWADYVFITGIAIQRDFARQVISRCKNLGKTIIAGGPLFTTEKTEYQDIDHLVLNEAEVTLPMFINDLRMGKAQHLYESGVRADLATTPLPDFSLIDAKNYMLMNVQYSRGCYFDCDFCDVTRIFGKTLRTKKLDQLLAELENIYRLGWRGGVFIVDDNFIANKPKLKSEILPALAAWMKEHGYPFTFNTQASINLSDDEELMRMMVEARFGTVFIGIETPHDESLNECAKTQNRKRDLVACIKKIQRCGLEVQGGFIVGFDHDPDTIFDKQIALIQESGIVTAMVGLLNALQGTRLYERLAKENRIRSRGTGDNTDLTINFIPRMDQEKLIKGYTRVVSTIYSPRYYCERVIQFLKECKKPCGSLTQFRLAHISAFVKSIVIMGVIERGRIYYWKLLLWALLKDVRKLPIAIVCAIEGFHYRKICERNAD